MLHKVIGLLRSANKSTSFQAYYNNVQRGRISGPTYDEARKDFNAYESTRYQRFGPQG